MKQTAIKRLWSLCLAGVLLLSCAAPVFALEPWELEWSLQWTVPNVRVENKTCSAMQGMDADSRFVYTAKTSSGDVYCALTRTDLDTGAQTDLRFFESPTATAASPCTMLSHANDLAVADSGGATALYVATVQKENTLARLQIRDDKAILTGFFRLMRADGTTPFAASAVTLVKHEGGKLYFLVKNALVYFACVIDDNAAGGTAQNPTPVICPRLFEIDTRNAQFYNPDGSTYRIDNLETWINQGVVLDRATNILYVPLWNGSNDNAILLYDASPFVTTAAMTATADSDSVLFPCNVSFRLYEPTLTQFEVESCAFRAVPDASGELLLYFNNNANSVAREGIYVTNYARNSVTLTPLVTADTLVYTVKYKANGGKENTSLSNWDRMNPTRHLGGVATNLRPNTFLPPAEDYIFRGWTLYRSSDKKWLYTLPNGTRGWYKADKQPDGAVRTLFADRERVVDLTALNGETFAAWAQWEQKQFTVTFDPAGGVTQFDSKTLHFGDPFGLLPAASREGMQFDGWFLPNGVPVTEEMLFELSENVVLTAHWSVQTPETPNEPEPEPEPQQGGLRGFLAFFRRIIDWFRSLFNVFGR